MGITVNGVEITDAMVEAELPRHEDARNPLQATVHELILRELLLQKARELGMQGDNDDELINAVISSQCGVPDADDAACETFYLNNPERFRNGDLVEASHILFQVTDTAPLELLRATANDVLEEVKAHPERFAELAQKYSNCPSGQVGGNLGQLQRGETVPEFDAVIFRLNDGEICESLVETRFGMHIIRVERRVEGRLMPFEMIKDQIAQFLTHASQSRALHQYLQMLVGEAKIEGFDMQGAESPLVQ